MKKMIVVLCVAIATIATAQNMIGLNEKEVYAQIQKKGVGTHLIEQSVIEGKDVISFLQDNVFRQYIFDNDICCIYSYSCSYKFYDNAITEYNTKAIRKNENTWVDYGEEKYTVTIKKNVNQFQVFVMR